MDLPVGDDAPKDRVPLTIPLRDRKSSHESAGRIFHRAFNAKYDRSIPELYRSIVKSRLIRQRRVHSILNARGWRTDQKPQCRPIYMYIRHVTRNVYYHLKPLFQWKIVLLLTAISHSVYTRVFFFIMPSSDIYSWDPKKKRGTRDLLPAPSAEDKRSR